MSSSPNVYGSLSPENERTRNRIYNALTTDMQTRLMPGGAIIIVMTRWHEDDLAGRLIEDGKNGGDKWHIISLPALLDEHTENERALWPEWFDTDAMRRRQWGGPSESDTPALPGSSI